MNDPHLLAWASVTNPLANDPRKGNKQELAGFWQDGTNLTFSQTRWLILFNNLCWRQTLDNFKYPLHSFSLTKYRWTSKKKRKSGCFSSKPCQIWSILTATISRVEWTENWFFHQFSLKLNFLLLCIEKKTFTLFLLRQWFLRRSIASSQILHGRHTPTAGRANGFSRLFFISRSSTWRC